MKIALLTYSTRPRGGVVHTLALAEALASLGDTVDVWSLARGGDSGFFRSVDPRVGLRLVPFPDVDDDTVGERIIRSIRVLGAAFSPADYDVVHAQDCISANAVPDCIRTVHHLDTFTTAELMACHERAIVMPAAHVCVSSAVAAEIQQGWGIEATVIPNGVDFARFAEAADDMVARQAWADRLGPYVLAVGGVEPRKGTLELITAMAMVQDARPELRLVIAGGETLFDYRSYRESVLARCSALGIVPALLGVVDHAALPSLVAQASAFAFPSTKEGFGLAAMEALAAGVPVVARDLPVLREVFGTAVRYASSATELGSLLLAATGPPDEMRMLRGRRLAAGFTWARAAEQHRALYTRLSPVVVR